MRPLPHPHDDALLCSVSCLTSPVDHIVLNAVLYGSGSSSLVMPDIHAVSARSLHTVHSDALAIWSCHTHTVHQVKCLRGPIIPTRRTHVPLSSWIGSSRLPSLVACEIWYASLYSSTSLHPHTFPDPVSISGYLNHLIQKNRARAWRYPEMSTHDSRARLPVCRIRHWNLLVICVRCGT